MLFPSREREAEAASALSIGSLAGKAPRHLPDICLARGKDAGIGPAEARRHSEALRFEGDDIGFGGWLDGAKRDGFGDGDDGERFCAARDLCDARHRLEHPKEIRRLHQHRADFLIDGYAQRLKIDLARWCEADFVNLQVQISRIGR